MENVHSIDVEEDQFAYRYDTQRVFLSPKQVCPVSSVAIFCISSVVSSKSKMSMFSLIRTGFADFTMNMAK